MYYTKHSKSNKLYPNPNPYDKHCWLCSLVQYNLKTFQAVHVHCGTQLLKPVVQAPTPPTHNLVKRAIFLFLIDIFTDLKWALSS
jgi:hypothetical protein